MGLHAILHEWFVLAHVGCYIWWICAAWSYWCVTTQIWSIGMLALLVPWPAHCSTASLQVGDLGLSKVKCHTLISGGVRGTLPWMAPELLNGSSSRVSEKVIRISMSHFNGFSVSWFVSSFYPNEWPQVDVFSFGIVMWELLTGEEPYADLHYGVIIGDVLAANAHVAWLLLVSINFWATLIYQFWFHSW